jgi:hypothetical protein
MAVNRTKNINPTYFQQVFNNTNGLSQSQQQFIQKVINDIKKHNGRATEKQYLLMQSLKTGNFKYSTKN